jgi:CubicO group peptidase (beta-lactamase class C family)
MKRKLAAAKTGDQDIAAYLDRKVFTPLGIAPQFQRDAVGNPNMAGGGRIGARAWATFGEMVLDGGVVHAADGTETRIVSESALQELLTSHGPNPRYGLTWWLLGDGGNNPEDEVAADLAADRLEPDPNDNAVRRGIRGRLADAARRRADQAAAEARKPENASAPIIGVMAAGKGKQRLYVLPEANLVVVRFGAIDGGNTYADAEFLKLLLGKSATRAPASTAPTSELPPK